MHIGNKIDSENTWKWLLKKETEGPILATQEQAFDMNSMKTKIQKTSHHSKYQLCKTKDETVDPMVSA